MTHTLIAAIREEMEWIRGLPILTPGATRRLLALRDVLAMTELAPQRFFMDEHTASGEWYQIPWDCRGEWDEFDALCEETSEVLPLPIWAIHLPDGSRWVEYEKPVQVLK